MKLGNNEKKKEKRKKISQRRVQKKKERQRSPDFTRNAQKSNGRLMYKTKGVESNPKGTSNAFKVPTQYNPQTPFEPL